MKTVSIFGGRFNKKRKAYWRLFRSRWRALKLEILRFFIRFVPKESQSVFALTLIVGAAAGIAAAFNAPISAVTLTIEEVVGDLDQTVLSGVIVAAAIAAAIERGTFSLTEKAVSSVTAAISVAAAA